MAAKPGKPFSSKGGKQLTYKGKDSSGTKFGGKPGGKKPFKPYKNTEKKTRPGKANDGGRKLGFSNAGKGPQGKRKLPADGRGPLAKKGKRGEKKLTDEELKKNRLQKKKELKDSRQQMERKEMFDIIRQCKGVWGNLRRKKCDEEQKKKLMKELHGLIRGKMKQELVAAVIQMFKGHIRQMLRHAAASTIVEYAYNDKAVLAQRLMITDELYGPTYAICKSLEHNTIEKVVKENPEKLENIMDETKQVIVPLTQNTCGLRGSKRNISSFHKPKTLISVQEVLSALPEVIGNKHGKKVLLYLLSPRDPAHMLPEIVKELEQGDGNAHSKKDMATRRRELLEAVSPALLEYLCENAATMVKDKATSVTISDILASACGDLRPAMTAVAQLANQELVPGGIKGEVRGTDQSSKIKLQDLHVFFPSCQTFL
ncbi:hypothetical protein XENOCAPTIV_005412 [Xenoophorus captivus]|uniref:CPL domain-containing protein n=1 Tax=Xenoophorus captivus TaxID=1517983 RepID=A0ABV0QGQ8_9TELE